MTRRVAGGLPPRRPGLLSPTDDKERSSSHEFSSTNKQGGKRNFP